MRIILFVFSILAFIAGVLVFTNAKSAIHEIEAFLLFLIFAVFLIGASICESIEHLAKK